MNPSQNQNHIKARAMLMRKEVEILFSRLKPFFWLYLDIGKYHNCPTIKRIAFDLWFEGKERSYGFSFAFEKERKKYCFHFTS
jgi:hypothetical protein